MATVSRMSEKGARMPPDSKAKHAATELENRHARDVVGRVITKTILPALESCTRDFSKREPAYIARCQFEQDTLAAILSLRKRLPRLGPSQASEAAWIDFHMAGWGRIECVRHLPNRAPVRSARVCADVSAVWVRDEVSAFTERVLVARDWPPDADFRAPPPAPVRSESRRLVVLMLALLIGLFIAFIKWPEIFRIF